MAASGATVDMSKPRKSPVGRPKAEIPIHSIVSLKGSADLETWLDELAEVSESGTRAHTLRRALKAFAESQGLKTPMPKR